MPIKNQKIAAVNPSTITSAKTHIRLPPITRINANSYFRSFNALSKDTKILNPEIKIIKYAIKLSV